MPYDDLLKIAWIPIVTAFIGWLTNWVAIRMLFLPRRPVRIFLWHWQGLLPRRHHDVADKVAELVESELLGQHVIRRELERLDLQGLLDHFIHRLIQVKVGQRLKHIPLLWRPRTLQLIERAARKAMREEFETMREKLADELEGHLQVKELVRDRIDAFEMEQLERIVLRVASQELKFIELLGAVLGFLIGVFQVLVLWWLQVT